MFNQVATPLQYTPRKFVIHSQSNNLVIIESDHNAFTDKVKEEKKQQIAEVCNSDNVVTALPQMSYLTYLQRLYCFRSYQFKHPIYKWLQIKNYFVSIKISSVNLVFAKLIIQRILALKRGKFG